MTVTKTQAIKAFLTAKTHNDLAELYNHDMEVQITVAKDHGERITGDFKGRQWHGYTDGIQTWKPIRIPLNAMSNPEYNDSSMTWDLAIHAEGIGMTGWDWKNRLSRWVAFDFDAIVGHSEKHSKKLSGTELENIKSALWNIPYVTIRTSTGGKGLHVYVFLEPHHTNNHTEHAAVARAVLSHLSGIAGFDFSIKVDTCVPADTWTMTSEGPRQVKDLINKATTLIVNGQEYNTNGFFRTRYEDVYELETEEGYKIQATADHKILTHYGFGYRNSEVIEIDQELQNLKPGDQVHLNNHKNISWGGEGSYNEGYILGWLYGDGFFATRGGKYHGLYFYPDDHYMLSYVLKLFKKETEIEYRDDSDSYCVWSEELEDLRLKFGCDVDKIITPHIEEASSEFLSGFISGLFDTDGTATKHNHIILSQSNLSRLEAVQRILLRFGIKSIIKLEREAGYMYIQGRKCKTKNKYTLTIGRENINVFNERIGFQNPNKRIKNQISIESCNRTLAKEKFLVTVRSVKLVGKKDVYCVKVPGINHFDANGLFVKNCGGNMWVWHRKQMLTHGEGLKLLKSGTELGKVPNNWEDYKNVVSGKRQRNLPKFIEEQQHTQPDIEDVFAQLTGQRVRVQLDLEHKKLLEWLDKNYPSAGWWDAENHMLVTHTVLLKEAHNILGLRGQFETLASGEEKGFDINCYAFPMSRGAWSVRRYTLGCAEHPYWNQDGKGWTTCWFNKEPTLEQAANLYGGIEEPAGGYWFSMAEEAQKAALLLGVNLGLPNYILGRKTRLKLHKSGRLIVIIDKDNDTPVMQGWLIEGKKFTKMFNMKATDPSEDFDVLRLDQDVRHIVTENNDDCGWVIRVDNQWNSEPFQHIKEYIKSRGYKPNEVSQILGSNINQCWRLVNQPFREEYPKDRQWNRYAAQLRYKPTLSKDNLQYPTWIKIINHLGKGLDAAIKNDEWCKSNNILTGSDWLKCWMASLFQEPTEPLPYLFFYGGQNSGKSIFHEALSILMTRGVCRADNALISQSGFNGELEGAVLCVIEETDLKKNMTAYNRIKDWVTSRMLPIHKKTKQPYMIPNTTHWIQCVPECMWIHTDEGPRQVKDLINKDINIILHNQKYKTKGFYKTGYKEVFEIKTDKGYSFKATDNHLVLVNFDDQQVWLEVSKLKENYSLCLNNHYNVKWGESNYEEGYILGHLFGDGSFRSDDPVLYVYQDLEQLNYLSSILDDCNILSREDGSFTIAGKQLKYLCKKYGLESKKDIYTLEIEGSDFYEGFLSGLFDTDGSCTEERKTVVFYQSDYNIIKTVQNMLLRLGIISCLYVSRPCGTMVSPRNGKIYNSKISYQLVIRNYENLKRFSERIGFRTKRKQRNLQNILKSWTRKAIDVEYTTKVVSISSVGYEEVYDITVPEVHAFSGDGFVLHNCSNSHLACPVFPGDTRITMIHVEPIDPRDLIPKKAMILMLEQEAQDFITELYSIELPASNDRLNVPCIMTEDKASAAQNNLSMLEYFIEEKCFYSPGHAIQFSDFFNRFQEWLDPQLTGQWTKIRVGKELPPKCIKGRMPNTGQFWIGNWSFEKIENDKLKSPFVLRDGKLYHEDK